MRPLKSLLSFDEALALCMKLAHPISRTELAPLVEAHSRVVADDVEASIDVPMADRAAMDGYAVRAADTFGATKFDSKTFRLLEVLYADSVPKERIGEGQCSEVATGSLLPPGADAVVMVEDTEKIGGSKVSIRKPVHPGQNVSKKGEDIKKGTTVVRRGELLNPSKIGALAAIGMDKVRVFRRPDIAVLTTGDEVIEPGEKIRPGLVYNINAYTIASVVKENGGIPQLFPKVPDKIEALEAAINQASKCDLVVFSGGSSVGERDLIIDALARMGELLFHGIAVKPGKPTVLGMMGKRVILGMPGYPTSCLSNCYLILAPMVRRMARLPERVERTVELPLSSRVVSVIGRMEFHTVRIEEGKAVPAFKESSAITSMAHADGYVRIPANVDLVEKGEKVLVYLF